MKRIKLYKYYILAIFTLSSMSCSVMEKNISRTNSTPSSQTSLSSSKIKKTHKFAELLSKKLLKRNGNAFYATSSYANVAYLWTYNEDKIYVYHLHVNKIQEVLFHTISWDYNKVWENMDPLQISNELIDSCGITLDGDYIKYQIKGSGGISSDFLIAQIDRIKRTKFVNPFLVHLSHDLNAYNIW